MSRTPGFVLRLLRTSAGAHSCHPQQQLKRVSSDVVRVATRGVSSAINASEHTAKWMTSFETQKSPQELIAEVPPIEVGARVVACEGSRDPALGHPIEYICLDLDAPAICKYCGLRYVQGHHHH